MLPLANNQQEERTAPPPAPRSDLRDFLGAVLLVIVGFAFAAGALRMPFKSDSWEWYSSPGIFALSMAVCLAGCSVVVGCRGLRGWLTNRVPNAPLRWREGLRAWGMGRFLASVAIILVYLILLGRVPFLVASAGLILVFGTAFREGDYLGGLRPAIIAALIIVGLSAIIARVFGVVFP